MISMQFHVFEILINFNKETHVYVMIMADKMCVNKYLHCGILIVM